MGAITDQLSIPRNDVNAAALLESQPQADLQRPDRRSRVCRAHPCLYQINTRVLLTGLSRTLQRPTTLDDVPDNLLDRLAGEGFDWVWFLGVWQTGAAGRHISLDNAEWRREFEELLHDFSDQDVCGPCFAIQSYAVHSDFGGNPALDYLRRRL